MNKEQTKRLMLGGFGLIGLLYVYFTFFLGPLNNSRNSIQGKINELEQKIATSKAEISKATKLEESAHAATVRYDAMRALSPDGAPIAWFPPRIKTFFAGQQIDKVTTRLEASNAFKEKELAGWNRYLWIVDLPRRTLGAWAKQLPFWRIQIPYCRSGDYVFTPPRMTLRCRRSSLPPPLSSTRNEEAVLPLRDDLQQHFAGRRDAFDGIEA